MPRQHETVGEIIREYLLENTTAFGQELYRAVKKKSKHRKMGSYGSFRSNYIYKLKKLKLIEFSHLGSAPQIRGFKQRTFYRIVNGREDSRKWRNVKESYDEFKRG